MAKIYLLCLTFMVLSCSTGRTNIKPIIIENAAFYSCETGEDYKSKPVIIKAVDLRNCFLKTKDQIVWISFYWQACPGQDIEKQKKAYEQFKDKINWIVVSETFDLPEIKKIQKDINHPIYFIDPSYSTFRLKNSQEYIKQVLQENLTEEALSHTNVFIKNGKVIKVAYGHELTENFFKQMLL